MTGRIGFCCKWVSPHGQRDREAALNQRTTTIAALSRLAPVERTAKLTDIVAHNMESLQRLLGEVAAQPDRLRLLRITSELLPAYTHPVAAEAYASPTMRHLVEDNLARIGAFARAQGVRLTTHPGQYTVLNATKADVLANAVREIEYHAELMAALGFAGWHAHGAAINVHAGGRAGGVDGFLAGFQRLCEQARNLLTVENDEISFGLDDLLPLAEQLPIVLDLHHHWIHSGGQYLRPDDPRIETVVASWRGLQPLGHISVSSEAVLPHQDPDERPDFAALTAAGVSPRALRAHSERMWNRAVNAWAACHLRWTDLEVEAKGKNLAARDLADQARATPCHA